MNNFPKPILINSKLWYNFDEIYKLYPDLFNGCETDKHNVIKIKNLKEDEYILCVYNCNDWVQTDCNFTTIFISKEWIEDNILHNNYYLRVKELEHQIELLNERHEREKVEYQNKLDKEISLKKDLDKKYQDKLDIERYQKKQLQLEYENKLLNKSKCIIS